MPKISELPETTGTINIPSLLALVQSGVTTKTTFGTLSSNLFDAGMQYGSYTARFVSFANTDPVYTEQYFTNSSKYVVVGKKLVLFSSICYVQAGTISVAGTGIAAVSIPPLGTYSWAAAIPSWHQGFSLGGTYQGLGMSGTTSVAKLKLRALQTQATTTSPDIYWASGGGNPTCALVNDASIIANGWGILA